MTGQPGPSEPRFGAAVAPGYDADSASMYAPAVLDPAVDFLADVAGPGGRALELAIGTGRVGLALNGRGVEVHGIDDSEPMLDVLRAKPGADAVSLVCGDMTTTRVAGRFDLVYLVYNTITNLVTQDDQVACFVNAAAHLRPGGRFVLECVLPRQRSSVFLHTHDRVAVDEVDVDDPRGGSELQLSSSHHHWFGPGRHGHERFSGVYRDAHPAELDLMARIAGLRLCDRWADWHRTPFTAASTSHVSVWARPA